MPAPIPRGSEPRSSEEPARAPEAGLIQASASAATPCQLRAEAPSIELADAFANAGHRVQLPHSEAVAVLEGVRDAGGWPLVVGGFVRDGVLGRPSKDLDVEVHGLSGHDLVKVLAPFGRVDSVGVSFGVIKLWTKCQEYDFSLPRRDNKTGAGHRGFQVEIDLSLTPEEAASRRDFTMNSLAYDPFSMEILDPYGGLEDLEHGVLRHTSDAFQEDPLRVLRGMQFAARFDLRMDPDTSEVCRGMAGEYAALARERVWGEWQKWAEKGIKPSRGLQVLQETGWLSHYPELNALVGVPQEQEWHPEGDVWTHTLHTVDAAAKVAGREGLASEPRTVLVLAALCHDMGKPTTTDFIEGRIRSRGHEQSGIEPAKQFLGQIGCPKALAAKVLPLVGNHLAHLGFPEDCSPSVKARFVRRLARRMAPSNLGALVNVIEADHGGRPPLPAELPENAAAILRIAEQLNLLEQPPRPIVMGRHLIEAGHMPGPALGPILRNLYELQMDGAFNTVEEGLKLAVKE